MRDSKEQNVEWYTGDKHIAVLQDKETGRNTFKPVSIDKIYLGVGYDKNGPFPLGGIKFKEEISSNKEVTAVWSAPVRGVLRADGSNTPK